MVNSPCVSVRTSKIIPSTQCSGAPYPGRARYERTETAWVSSIEKMLQSAYSISELPVAHLKKRSLTGTQQEPRKSFTFVSRRCTSTSTELNWGPGEIFSRDEAKTGGWWIVISNGYSLLLSCLMLTNSLFLPFKYGTPLFRHLPGFFFVVPLLKTEPLSSIIFL